MNDDYNNDIPQQPNTAADGEKKNEQAQPLAEDAAQPTEQGKEELEDLNTAETGAAGEDGVSAASGNAEPAPAAAAGGGSCEAAKEGEEPSAFAAGNAQDGYSSNAIPQPGQYNCPPQNPNYSQYQNRPTGQPYGQYQNYAAGASQGGYSGGYYYGNAPRGGWQPQQPNSAPQNINQTGNPYAAVQPSVSPYPQGNGAPHYAQPPKKKTSAGLIIFLIIAAIVLLVCGIFAVYAVSQSTEDVFGNSGVFDRQQPDSDDDYSDGIWPFFADEEEDPNALSDSDLVDTTNENAAELKLEKQPSDIFTSDKYTAKNAYDKAKESVVGIVAYNDREMTEIGSQGTGIVISSDGYIVTNSHVIDDSKKRYKVAVIIGGEEIEAQVTGYDTRTDIAVLKIEKTGLTPASFANSDEVQVGQEVVAIGNPGGIDFSNSITQGIVSALDRDLSRRNVSYIQTDAAINPGNSGGPLLNMSGQVIGITTIKIINTSYEGMGFAIPSQQAADVINSIIKQGYVEGRVRIGITGNEINSTYASYYDMPVGIYVVSIDADGPLADSELQEGDIITKIDDVEITSFSVLYNELDKHSAGDTVTLTYEYLSSLSDEYEEETLTVTLETDIAE